MAFHIIAEALARIEHKLDAILRHGRVPAPAPMSFMGTTCPACNQTIEYQVDLQHNVVVRKCQCSTGKFVSSIPLFPTLQPPGVPNARPDDNRSSSDSSEREDS